MDGALGIDTPYKRMRIYLETKGGGYLMNTFIWHCSKSACV